MIGRSWGGLALLAALLAPSSGCFMAFASCLPSGHGRILQVDLLRSGQMDLSCTPSAASPAQGPRDQLADLDLAEGGVGQAGEALVARPWAATGLSSGPALPGAGSIEKSATMAAGGMAVRTRSNPASEELGGIASQAFKVAGDIALGYLAAGPAGAAAGGLIGAASGLDGGVTGAVARRAAGQPDRPVPALPPGLRSTLDEARAQDPELDAALERLAAGSATDQDLERLRAAVGDDPKLGPLLSPP